MKLTFEEFNYCTVGVNKHCVFKNAFLKIRSCVGQNGLQHVCIRSSSSFECVWIELWSTKSNLLSMLMPVIMYVVSCCNLSVGFCVGGTMTVIRFLSPKMASAPLSTLCTCSRYTVKSLAAFLMTLRIWPTTVTVEGIKIKWLIAAVFPWQPVCIAVPQCKLEVLTEARLPGFLHLTPTSGWKFKAMEVTVRKEVTGVTSGLHIPALGSFLQWRLFTCLVSVCTDLLEVPG